MDKALADPTMFEAKDGDAEHKYICMLCESMRGVAQLIPLPDNDPRMFLTCLIAAASMLAGTAHGQLEAIGEIPRHMRKKVKQSAARNYDSGMAVGAKIAARTLMEEGLVQ